MFPSDNCRFSVVEKKKMIESSQREEETKRRRLKYRETEGRGLGFSLRGHPERSKGRMTISEQVRTSAEVEGERGGYFTTREKVELVCTSRQR